MAAAGHGVEAVVFDYGEVISLPPSAEDRTALERLAGGSAEEFWSAYWAERRAYDAGISGDEYWRRVADRLGAAWDSAARQALWAVDVGSWLHVRPESTALLERLADRGVRLALLSNAPFDIAGALRHSPVLARFEELFFSADLGRCKPDPQVYRHILDRLGTPPERTAFVDDREENILAAKELGIVAHHYAGTADLEAFLADLVGSPA
ncbi:HAD family hydrolase [Streptomonospora nanhaiensis]|uniref:Putative hydrolase of the HAD superfamily n=1 Tax=Streptomonospora nanhaiensis TaxID=1323731 RepID=A0A853BTL6_9ACTN|nr:HAD family phosphatase [Streptomonospora nanhaiensis]MBV2363634.1 HAD family phosphatase [Streptomonospora nanhaiensis]MBX9391090.1 HAD family phosphatase [Streptomonospora nanhaiensis]NYI98678.1 putative hydrolase of the HAD superfamily [Streptomonospora nanhaiensis]